MKFVTPLSNGKAHAMPASGAAMWLFCFQFFVAEQIARLAYSAPYSMANNVISDLGAVRFSPLHALMNGSFILQGCLIIFGALLGRNAFPRTRMFRSALILLALAGIGVFVVGFFPEDTSVQVHTAGAAVNFLCGSIAMLLLGAGSFHAKRRWGGFSLLAGAFGFSATLLLGLASSSVWHSLGLGTGTVERIAAYPLPLWLTVSGFLLLRCSLRW